MSSKSLKNLERALEFARIWQHNISEELAPPASLKHYHSVLDRLYGVKDVSRTSGWSSDIALIKEKINKLKKIEKILE